MPEIEPDPTDESRCLSVHWSLPTQCVLSRGHRENWHETWHPQGGDRIRYRRCGIYRTEELRPSGWVAMEIPPPGGYCNDQRRGCPGVFCTQPFGHGWYHRAIVDGCTHSWNTPVPKALTSRQLDTDVKTLRGLVVQLTAELDQAQAENRDLTRALGLNEEAAA